MEKQYTRETLLTTVTELQKKLGSSTLCIIDTRPAENFATGHIPGSTHFDLFGLSLVDTTDAPLKAFMFMIHHVLELRGVSEAKEVVFYGENSDMRAARGVWFLEYYGHPKVKMLDGGFKPPAAGSVQPRRSAEGGEIQNRRETRSLGHSQ
jgi:thiosulfate/3-mercaptopyruvate sulfurtransferase